jgi:2-polyprenyl-6-methoxyphenol hydroxylase-like FAD-dependent oxidoreductase
MGSSQVLIAGAGPTGLALALWLTCLGVRVRIIDKTAAPVMTSRAVAVQARTLEFYRQIGLAPDVVERSRRATAVNLWVRRRQVTHAVFGDMGRGVSPFPYTLLFAQDEHERLLIARLADAGVEVERQTELTGFEQTSEGVAARLAGPRGDELCDAAFLAGCDGAHSTVRETLRIGFQGGTYAHLFYIADVDGRGPALNGEVHVALDTSDFLVVLPLKGDGRARLIGTIREHATLAWKDLSWDDVSRRVLEWMRLDVDRVNWFSTYHVHHRVAERFGVNRAFLLGDAAHIHSPVGGQGMNTGIGDAVNLAWKLAAVLRGHAADTILASYEAERIAFAQRLVATTDRAFTAVTSDSATARFIRLEIAPRIVPLVFASRAARRFMFRIVSQTAINYHSSPLSAGRAGRIRGGDRLPWVDPEQTRRSG